jgi:hypothetical protein
LAGGGFLLFFAWDFPSPLLTAMGFP